MTTLPERHEVALAATDDTPRRGELKIKEKRTWKTWQLLAAVLVAAVAGMAINGNTGGGTSNASGAGSPQATRPPPNAASGSTGGSAATTTTAAGGGSGTTTTTAAGGSTTTTTAPGGATTTTTASTTSSAAGPARQLLLSPQSHGNWTSTSFTTTAAPWNIGWAFQCTPAPAGGTSFQVFVVPAGGSPSGTPAVSGTGASGQSVTAQSSLGAQTLVVQAPASCTWIVKVTGS